jgi:sulfatase-modifying factor enzyme 1
MNGLSYLHAAPHVALLAAFVGVPWGCQSSSAGATRGVGLGPLQPLVSIAGGTIESGFARGPLRQQRTLSSYDIMRYPVTWADFNACVQAKACTPADGAACTSAAYGSYSRASAADPQVAQQPALCLGESQAEAFCHWIGGRLPKMDEWLLAARGQSPTEFPWGDTTPTCAQYPVAPPQGLVAAALPAMGPPACVTGGASDPALAVRQHPGGASAAGVEDLLLAPGELLASDVRAMFNACAHEDGHCVVFGLQAAAIDGVEPVYEGLTADGGRPRLATHAYALRCAFDAK